MGPAHVGAYLGTERVAGSAESSTTGMGSGLFQSAQLGLVVAVGRMDDRGLDGHLAVAGATTRDAGAALGSRKAALGKSADVQHTGNRALAETE